ncbi:unnamed protein product, partial [Polarella glacialis]
SCLKSGFVPLPSLSDPPTEIAAMVSLILFFDRMAAGLRLWAFRNLLLSNISKCGLQQDNMEIRFKSGGVYSFASSACYMHSALVFTFLVWLVWFDYCLP